MSDEIATMSDENATMLDPMRILLPADVKVTRANTILMMYDVSGSQGMCVRCRDTPTYECQCGCCSVRCTSCRGTLAAWLCHLLNALSVASDKVQIVPFGANSAMHTCWTKMTAEETFPMHKFIDMYRNELVGATFIENILRTIHLVDGILVIYTDGQLNDPQNMIVLLEKMKTMNIFARIKKIYIVFAPHTTASTQSALVGTYTRFFETTGDAIQFEAIKFNKTNPNQMRDFLLMCQQTNFSDVDTSKYHDLFGEMFVPKITLPEILHLLLSDSEFASAEYAKGMKKVMDEMICLVQMNPLIFNGEIGTLALIHRILVRTPLKEGYQGILSGIMSEYQKKSKTAEVAAVKKLLDAAKETPAEEMAKLFDWIHRYVIGVLELPGNITPQDVREAIADGSCYKLKALLARIFNPDALPRFVTLDASGVIPVRGMPVLNADATPAMYRAAMSMFFRGVIGIDNLRVTGAMLTNLLLFIISSEFQVPDYFMQMIMRAFLDENHFIYQIGFNLLENTIVLPEIYAAHTIVRAMVDCLHLHGDALLNSIPPASRNVIFRYFRSIETTYNQSSAIYNVTSSLPKELVFSDTIEVEKPVGRFRIAVGCLCFVKEFSSDPRNNVPTVFLVLEVKGSSVWGWQLDQDKLLHVDVDAVSPFPYPDTHNIQKSNAVPISEQYITGFGQSFFEPTLRRSFYEPTLGGDVCESAMRISTDLHILSLLPEDHPIMKVHMYLRHLIDMGGVYSLGHPLIPEVLAQAKDRVIELITGTVSGPRMVSGDITVKIPLASLLNFIGHTLNIPDQLISYLRQGRNIDMKLLMQLMNSSTPCPNINTMQKHYVDGIEASIDTTKYMIEFVTKVQKELGRVRVLGGLSELREMFCVNCLEIHPISEFDYLDCHHVICKTSNADRIATGARVTGQQFHMACHQCPIPGCRTFIESDDPIINAYIHTNVPDGTISSCCDTCQGLFGQVLACGSDAVRATTCPTCIATAERLQHETEVARIGASQALIDDEARAIRQRMIVECPRCKQSVSRTGGCDVMDCNCGAHFCYGCCVELPSEVFDWECCTRIAGIWPYEYTNSGEECDVENMRNDY